MWCTCRNFSPLPSFPSNHKVICFFFCSHLIRCAKQRISSRMCSCSCPLKGIQTVTTAIVLLHCVNSYLCHIWLIEGFFFQSFSIKHQCHGSCCCPLFFITTSKTLILNAKLVPLRKHAHYNSLWVLSHEEKKTVAAKSQILELSWLVQEM